MDADQTIDFSNHQILEASFSSPPLKKISKCSLALILSIFYGSVFFLAYISFVRLPSDPSDFYVKKPTLDESISLKISRGYSIPVDSLEEMTFSTTASLSLMDSNCVLREPIDFAFVIDFPGARDQSFAEEIKNACQEALPLIGDQDRLFTIIFDEGHSQNGPIFNFVPLAPTTEENKNTIFANLGEEFSAKESSGAYCGLQIAIQSLNQRENMNSATGIMLYAQKCNREQISEILQGLKSPQAFVFCSEPQGSRPLYIPFKENLEELQTSLLVNVYFFAKPLQTEFFQGVEIVKTEFEEYDEETTSRMFIGKGLSLFPIRQRRFVIDIKIPNPTPPLPVTTMEVKIANFEMVFTSLDGQKVVKNRDFAIEIESSETMSN